MAQLAWEPWVVGWPSCSNLGSQWAWSPTEWELTDVKERSPGQRWEAVFVLTMAPQKLPRFWKLSQRLFFCVGAVMLLTRVFCKRGKNQEKEVTLH